MIFKKFGREKFNKLRDFYKRYERWLVPGALFFGFLTDLITFGMVLEPTVAIYIFSAHLAFAGVNIVAVNYFKEKSPTWKPAAWWEFAAPLFVQFSFGNLFSAFFIFYSKSGSFFASWPFLLVFIVLFVGNELARRRHQTPLVQIGVYFFLIFSYLNLAFPYLFNRLGWGVFLASGLLSLLVAAGFVTGLSRFFERVKERQKMLWAVVAFVFLAMNFLYFTNLIPPIPLTIKDIGVYHDIQKSNGNYRVLAEKCQSWYGCFWGPKKIHITQATESVYVFSAIHAPLGMSLEAAHEWYRYNDKKEHWQQISRLVYGIRGGREGGYRLYTYNLVTPGLWRVNVETRQGQVIGRKTFRVVESNTKPEFVEKTK